MVFVQEHKHLHMEKKELIGDRQLGFSKSRLCLINLVAFSNRVMALVERGRATDIIYLVLCKLFATVPHDIRSLNWRAMKGWTDHLECKEF